MTKSFDLELPVIRPRRMRQAEWMRDLVSEHALLPHQLIQPIFVRDPSTDQKIPSMDGVLRLLVDELPKYVEECLSLGIKAIALFPCVDAKLKSPNADEAFSPDNLICQSLRLLKKTFKNDIGLITDVALDPYTSHGQDGLMVGDCVDNDETLAALCMQALVQAEAGADIVAPSDMMDGRVYAIRSALDQHNFQNVSIMSYGAKYASSFYGPFRDALNNKAVVDRDLKKTYQMDPKNSKEALREMTLDVEEGADMLIVKPGLPYLDIVHMAAQTFDIPVFAYHVSGEYAMLKAASLNGWLDYDQALIETLISFIRAGATGVLTYGARDAAKLLKGKHA